MIAIADHYLPPAGSSDPRSWSAGGTRDAGAALAPLGRTGILAAKARIATVRASRGGALAAADVLDPEVSAG
jgi:hypothetical protein